MGDDLSGCENNPARLFTPIHPSSIDRDVPVCFLDNVAAQTKFYPAGARMVMLATLGANTMIADSVDSGEPDLIRTDQLSSLCKCAPVAEARGKTNPGTSRMDEFAKVNCGGCWCTKE